MRCRKDRAGRGGLQRAGEGGEGGLEGVAYDGTR